MYRRVYYRVYYRMYYRMYCRMHYRMYYVLRVMYYVSSHLLTGPKGSCLRVAGGNLANMVEYMQLSHF